MIKRVLEEKIAQKLDKGKAILVIGPRQVGKTTLFYSILENREHLFLDGDDSTVRNLLTDPNTEQLKSIIGNHNTLFIDEAQRIENIGLTLKIITDQFKKVQLLVTLKRSQEKLRALSLSGVKKPKLNFPSPLWKVTMPLSK